MKQKQNLRKTGAQIDLDEILPEYDFSRSRPNMYASRYAAGSVVVVLESDVAAVLSDRETNEAPVPRRAASRRSALTAA